MVADGSASVESLWHSIRQEAEAVAARDPVFAVTLARTIFDHPDLGSAITFQIGQRLGTVDADQARFTRIANEAFRSSPDLVEAAGLDLQGIVAHDPAVTALLPPLLNYKGFVALEGTAAQAFLDRRAAGQAAPFGPFRLQFTGGAHHRAGAEFFA